jgi:hypothetical protein
MTDIDSSATPRKTLIPAASPAKSETKADTVNRLLRRAKGATVTDIMFATSWQPHSVRAFLSGLRKKGTEILREQRKSGETAYRIAKTDGAR